MQPIQYNGQVYFTSQYFHQTYRNNSGSDDGKYKELKNFNVLIRSIEAYGKYITRGDIVELTREEAGSELEPVSEAGCDLQPVFKANYGNPIMLINATAQIALTHHLDDEISKSASVNVNQKAATSDGLIDTGIADPTLNMIANLAIVTDGIKQRVIENEQKTQALEAKSELILNRLEHVEIQHKHGIPEGHYSKKQAHHLFATGLSSEIFHAAMTKIGVTVKPYMHRTDDGYENPTHAYKIDEIQSAMDLFLEDAVQVTTKTCESPMLSGKRFRYCKEAVA